MKRDGRPETEEQKLNEYYLEAAFTALVVFAIIGVVSFVGMIYWMLS